MEQLERIREKGGWAAQCPTEGGTDEVRGKWRETKQQGELRKGTHKEQKLGSFPFTKTDPQREITFTPELKELRQSQTHERLI